MQQKFFYNKKLKLLEKNIVKRLQKSHPGPGKQDQEPAHPEHKTQDPEFRTQEQRLRIPKLGNLELRTFLLNFKIKR